MKLFNLTGRVAIVTGGNSGIGFGIAEGLAAAGATLIIAGRRADANAAAVKALRESGAQAFSIEADIAQETDCTRLVAQSAERAGRVDILVNNAGIAIRKQPQDYSTAEWRQVIDVNLSSAFYCAQAAYPHMCRAGGGKIINIGSMMSIFGAAFAVAYGASKGGIVQMTKGLATAWAKDNIQSNAILPGWIDTPFTRTAREQVAGLNERVLARTPAGRWGSPGDFAGAAVFLASSASGFVNGASLVIDGGYSSMG
ncbi:SDR family NAD(P)-dependent oxidoreductase [Pseudorhodoplanes sp.]|uniref:SDR family NAD(P)-dependent oxidoreductase n=1 Tax=Pseudorhodoplanes sp. TaxID=1934341 RepID=UPI003D10B0B9